MIRKGAGITKPQSVCYCLGGGLEVAGDGAGGRARPVGQVGVGAGFAGLKIAQKLAHTDYQIVLFDKNNYHQFQPLLYQVATAALSPSAVSFPLRRIFHKIDNVVFRMAVVREIDKEKKTRHAEPAYKKDPAPTKEVNESVKKDSVVLEEMNRIKNMANYNKKTQ